MRKRKTGTQILDGLKGDLEEVYDIRFVEAGVHGRKVAQPLDYRLSAEDLTNLEEGVRLLERFVNRWPEPPSYARKKRQAARVGKPSL